MAQFAGSLLAILALAWLARALRLGKPPRLLDDAAARYHANAAVEGFAPVDIARDRDGRSAILRDAHGRFLILKPHGAHFAARLLKPPMTARTQDGALVIQTGERLFGDVTLQIADPQAWENAINAIN